MGKFLRKGVDNMWKACFKVHQFSDKGCPVVGKTHGYPLNLLGGGGGDETKVDLLQS